MAKKTIEEAIIETLSAELEGTQQLVKDYRHDVSLAQKELNKLQNYAHALQTVLNSYSK